MEKQRVLVIYGDMARSPQTSGIAVGDHAETETPPYWLPLVVLLSVLFWAGVIWAVL